MPKPVYNPFSGEDEVIIKDKDGNVKVLSGGKIQDLEKKEDAPRNEIGGREETSRESGGAAEKDAREQDGAEDFSPKPIVVREVAVPESSGIDYENISKQMISKLGLEVHDEVLQKRFVQILSTRLRGIRDAIETREILLRSSKIGGMGFTEKMADMAVVAAEKVIENISDGESDAMKGVRGADKESRNTSASARKESFEASREPAAKENDEQKNSPSDRDILQMIEELPEYDIFSKTKKDEKESEQKHDAASSQAGGGETEEKKNAESEPSEEKPEEKAQLGEKTTSQEKREEKNESASPEEAEFRPRSKTPHHLLGPIDEIREIDEVEFRRIDQDPKKACRKILEKLAVLEKDSFAKKALGIAAWRESRIFRLYVTMGRMSIVEKISIQDVGDTLKKEGKPYLTPEEFDAIMEFNESLRF